MFDWENAKLCMQCRGIGPHLVARGKSDGFSRVAAGTELWALCDPQSLKLKSGL